MVTALLLPPPPPAPLPPPPRTRQAKKLPLPLLLPLLPLLLLLLPLPRMKKGGFAEPPLCSPPPLPLTLPPRNNVKNHQFPLALLPPL